jgi:hypothetical protein
MTAKSSADIGMTRSRSVLKGAMTSRATTSPFGRRYWRMLSWESSRNSSMRMPAQTQSLDDRPAPEGAFLFPVDVDNLGAAALGQPYVCPAVLAFAAGVGGAEHPGPGPAAGGESLAGCGGPARLEELGVMEMVVPGLVDEAGQQRLALPGPVGGFLGDLAAAPGDAAQLASRYGAWRHPYRPPGGLLQGPGGQVEVDDRTASRTGS